jgi:putative Holliday junction resolvase
MGRVLGIDLGTRTLGLALSDEGWTIAQPLRTLRRIGPRKDVEAVARLMEESEVERVVLGDPRNMDGSPGQLAGEVERFAAALTAATGRPVDLWDERLTTVAAERALLEGNVRRDRRKKVIDQVAAALILQGWLDRAPAKGEGSREP